MKKIFVIYDWPDSQICMDCVHGEFIDLSVLTSAYACTRYCLLNDGVDCPKKETTELTEKEEAK